LSNINVEIKNGLFVCLAICAADGFISDEEEESLYDKFNDNFGISKVIFEDLVNIFFESQVKIEIYLDGVCSKELKNKLLTIARDAAAVDGFDITENIAWDKCKNYWGLDNV
jgi:tellurite resistance protein